MLWRIPPQASPYVQLMINVPWKANIEETNVLVSTLRVNVSTLRVNVSTLRVNVSTLRVIVSTLRVIVQS